MDHKNVTPIGWRFAAIALMISGYLFFFYAKISMENLENPNTYVLLIYKILNLIKNQTLRDIVNNILAYLPLFVFVITLFFGLRMYQYSKLLKQNKVVFENFKFDEKKSLIIYLRSFKDDKILEKNVFLDNNGILNEEEILTDYFSKFGEFIGVGDPREDMPKLGARRTYMNNEHWRENIATLISKAELIVFRAGFTEGFWWEFQNVMQLAKPQKIIMFIPFDKNKYKNFQNEALERIKIALPTFSGKQVTPSQIRGFIYFSDNWSPNLVGFKGTHIAIKNALQVFTWFAVKSMFSKRNELQKQLDTVLSPIIYENLLLESPPALSNSNGTNYQAWGCLILVILGIIFGFLGFH